MPIWSAEIKELEKLYESIKGQLPDLEKELGRLVKADDENMILLYSRRCLEVIITDLCECELKRPRKTEPLKGIIDKLHKEEKVPSHIITSMHGLNELSTYGAHPKDFDPEQVKPVLNNLDIIIKWYLRYKESGKGKTAKSVEVIIQDIKVAEEAKKNTTIPKKNLIGIVPGLILVIAIVVAFLLITKIIGGRKLAKGHEKSIAVLPFKLLSDEPDQQYLADGMMDAITLHLSKIKDLHVMSRTSVEQYRGTTKTTRTIGQELDVAYLLEGSFQKYGDDTKLIVQLIKASEESHAWANEYKNKWRDVFALQSDVAKEIASELNAVISPQEKQLIEKTPTTNLTAYDFFQRGREEHMEYMSGGTREALESAEDLYHKALEYDSKFAQAYTGLAIVYWNKHYWSDYFSENFLDSALILADIALTYDDQLSEAYSIKGVCYYQIGKYDNAFGELDKALKFNPNDWMAYFFNGNLYSNIDLVKSIDNYNKAISLNRGTTLPAMLQRISWIYNSAGFIEEFENCNQEALELNGDSASYFSALSGAANHRGNYKKAIEYAAKAYALNPDRTYDLWLMGYNNMMLGQYEESMKYYKKYVEKQKDLSYFSLNGTHRIGFVYWENGYKKEAESYFDMQIKYSNDEIKLERGSALTFFQYYDLAGIYAFRGEREKAYENLRIFNQRQWMPLNLVRLIKDDPLFNSIRNEPEFQQIVRDVEAKYQAEHERVRKWLEEQGML